MIYKTTALSKSFRAFLFVFQFFAVLAAVSDIAAQSSVDLTFAPSLTKAATATSAAAFAVQADGKVVFVDNETVGTTTSGFIQRVNSDGSSDLRFSCDVCAGLVLNSVAIANDGKILVGGFTSDGISLLFAKIYRFNADGSRDTTFAFAGVNGNASKIVAMADGRLVVYFTSSFQGFTSNFVRRVNVDGSFDTTFASIALSGGRTSYQILSEVRVLTDGRVVLGGTIVGFSSSATLARYTSTGVVDPTFEVPGFSDNRNTSTSIGGVALLPDGGMYVTGDFTAVNGVARVGIVKLLPAGNVDLTYTGSVEPTETAGHAELLADGRLLTESATVLSGFVFMRFNLDGTLDSGYSAPDSSGHFLNWQVDAAGRALFAKTAGYFRLTTTGALDTTFNVTTQTSGWGTSVTTNPDGRVVVAGNFAFANAAARARVARLTATGATDTVFQPVSGFDSNPSLIVRQADGKYVFVGDFTNYNGAPVSRLARVNDDGSLDASFAPVINGGVVSVVQRTDGKLYIGGNFSAVGGVSQAGVALLNSNGTLDASFAPTIGTPSIAWLALQSDGKLFVGGTFNGVNGFGRQNLARLNADGTLDTAFNAGAIGSVIRLASQPDGKVIVGGAASISRRNADGSADASFTSVSYSGLLYTMLLQSNGAVIIGGSLTNVAGQNRQNLARIGANGTVDTLFLPLGVNGNVFGLSEQADGKVIAVGQFSSVDGVARSGIVRFAAGAVRRPTRFDFDGDGRADFTVFRASANKWYVLQTSDFSYTETTFAIAGDVPVPADYDGDGKTDHAIYRNGAWWYRSSINGAQINVNWGSAGDIPRPSDIDGDGKTDFVLYRPSTGTWYRMTSFGAQTQIGFGAAGDQPVTGDFDGDGKADPAVFRPSTGDWWYAASSANGAHRPVHWGATGDVPVPADYDGDGKTDFAIFRPSEGGWFVSSSADGSFRSLSFGQLGDRPISADYDGDGKADIGVFRPSTGTWYLLQSTAGFGALQWGVATDAPIPSAFLP